MRPRLEALVLFGVAACRIGGPSANPDQYVTFPPGDAGAQDEQGIEPGAGDDATVGSAGDATAGPNGDDASPLDTDDGGGGDDASGDDGSCGPTVAICNPVRNTGCNPLQQCDVDTSQKTMPTGICVFNSGTDAGGPCSASFVSESCPPFDVRERRVPRGVLLRLGLPGERVLQ